MPQRMKESEMTTILILIIIILIAVAAIVTLIFVLRSAGSTPKKIDIHMSNGAHLSHGYISYDNNFFKGLSGEMEKTGIINQNMRHAQYEGKNICLVHMLTSRTYQLTLRPEVVLGRMDDDGIFTVADDAVSKRHCRILFDGTEVYLEDMGSLNHTFLNENIVKQPTALSNDDIIRIGNTRFRVLL